MRRKKQHALTWIFSKSTCSPQVPRVPFRVEKFSWNNLIYKTIFHLITQKRNATAFNRDALLLLKNTSSHFIALFVASRTSVPMLMGSAQDNGQINRVRRVKTKLTEMRVALRLTCEWRVNFLRDWVLAGRVSRVATSTFISTSVDPDFNPNITRVAFRVRFEKSRMYLKHSLSFQSLQVHQSGCQ